MSDQKDAPVTEPTVAPVTDPVAEKLKKFGATDDVVVNIKTLGVESVDDLIRLEDKELVAAGFNIIQARKLLEGVAPAPQSEHILDNTALDVLLPGVQDDESWLKSLKTGGVLKVDTSTITAAVRAALAKRVSLYDVPAKLVTAMEAFSEESEEQVNPLFYSLRKQVTRRDYAAVFEAVEGLDGTFVTEKRKTQLLGRLEQNLWPALISFNQQLVPWHDAFILATRDLGSVLGRIMPGAVLGAGITQPVPDTAVLQDAADTVKDAINKVFAGTGVQIAAALAYEATEIKKILADPRLPAFTGAVNREQMLKKLNVAVPASYPRLETNLTKYVLAVAGLEDQASGQEEYGYLNALRLLGDQIDWSQLGGGLVGGGISTLGRTSRRSEL
ncbi:hypothetical protein HY312_01310 [Candidatus Saccharibacteria bacterium]|nr:hypothetical protein [Candidatus Saccharibacteria bacterium]